MKRNNTYNLKVEEVALKDETLKPSKSLEFQFENHDNVFDILDAIENKNLFNDSNQDKEFAIGLKLFSEVLIKNRKHEIFKEFSPHFKMFMQKLKAY
ncbi:DUF3861 domain-containing protein [Winogradskyella sp.]|uniref:DUF3861 domain-containing protein n=1 Tax=Winogradskyella sp. TaxID=1883156 RepID=UPI003AA916C4